MSRRQPSSGSSDMFVERRAANPQAPSGAALPPPSMPVLQTWIAVPIARATNISSLTELNGRFVQNGRSACPTAKLSHSRRRGCRSESACANSTPTSASPRRSASVSPCLCGKVNQPQRHRDTENAQKEHHPKLSRSTPAHDFRRTDRTAWAKARRFMA